MSKKAKRRRTAPSTADGARSGTATVGLTPPNVPTEERPSASLSREERLASLGVASLTLAAYLVTLYPSLPGGDSGELIAVAHRLGIAHPPGYPLFTLLGKLFTLLPIGTVAYRANLMSAVCDAGASVLLMLSVARATGAIAPGVMSALLFAFSSRVWTHAIGAEVFPLNNLFVASLLFLTVTIYSRRTGTWVLRVGALLFGLGLANHHTLAFVGLPLAIAAVWPSKERLIEHQREASLLVLMFALGLLPYAYLPWAASRSPIISWGEPSTLAGFVHHFLRRDYGTFRLAGETHGSGHELAHYIGAYLKDVAHESLGIGLILAVLGAVAATRSLVFRPLVLAGILGPGIYLGVFHALTNLPIESELFLGVLSRFWQQANLFVFAWAGVGAFIVAAKWPRRITWLSIFAMACLQAFIGFRVTPSRAGPVLSNFGRELFAHAPQRALVISRGDLFTNALRYLQLCEDLRPDTVIIDQEMLTYAWYNDWLRRTYPDLSLPGRRYHPRESGAYSMKQLLEANQRTFPVVLCGGYKAGDDSANEAFETWPSGLCATVLPKGDPPPIDTMIAHSRSTLTFANSLTSLSRQPDSWEDLAALETRNALATTAAKLLNAAIAKGNDGSLLRLSVDQMITAEALGPVEPAFYKNLGIAYERLALSDSSLTAKRDQAWRTYLDRADGTDPDLKAIRQALAR